MKIPTLAAVAATALLTLSACGSGGSSTAAQPPASQKGAGAAGTGVAQTSLGKVLVDGQGMTLYTLSADGRDKSTCATQCLQFWPAVSPGSLASASTGDTATPDGTAIATVAGHPVYTFALDHNPGDVNGEGVNEFGGTWYAVSPTGKPVTAATSPSSATSAPSSGGGYSY
jgi:predicted lipoprotein with Yx(FWY)xxD motif